MKSYVKCIPACQIQIICDYDGEIGKPVWGV